MGGLTSSSNHVDGGTSRFDKSGRIYHSVCGGCGGNPTGFTSTPGSWSQFNQSSNCNMATFKFELSSIDAVVPAVAPLICILNLLYFKIQVQMEILTYGILNGNLQLIFLQLILHDTRKLYCSTNCY